MFSRKRFSEKIQCKLYKKRVESYEIKSINTIGVVFYIPKSNTEKYENWSDGFTEAIKILQKEYQITWINLADSKPDADFLNKFDFLIVKSCWDWIVDEYIRSIKNLYVPRGIAVSCSKLPKNENSVFFYDVLWYETFWYGKQLNHPRKIHAFGINTEVFKEEESKKKYDVISIGALAKYKRHHKIKEMAGRRLVVGHLDTKDSTAIIKELHVADIEIEPFTSQQSLAKLINQSKMVYIPAEKNGGGERAVLEARSCNVPVKIEDDNPKLKELISSPIWNQEYYAQKLKEGLFFNVKKDVKESFRMNSDSHLWVGKNSFHNGNFQIKGDEWVKIGSFCSFGKNISIITSNHDTNYACTQGYLYRFYFDSNHPGEINFPPNKERSKGPVIIGNDVWIGDDVKIMSGVKIGDGACIAANSVVVKNVDPYEVSGGIPNKRLKMRFKDEVISFLNKIEWWFWTDEKLRKNEEFFKMNLNEISDVAKINIQ